VVGVPGPARRRIGGGGRDTAPRVRHGRGGHGVEPAHDRHLGGIFTAAGAVAVADAAASASGAALMLGGVALGTLSAFTALSLLVALVRGRFGPRLMATVDVVAGAGLLGFAGLLGWRTVDDA
jgi:hypothetical protein